MTTITIPRNLIKEIKEKDLVLISRSQYENLLKHSETDEEYEHSWKNAVKNTFFQSYSKSDEIYDQI